MCLNLRPQLNKMLHYTRIDRPSEVGVLVGHGSGLLAQGVEYVLSKSKRDGKEIEWDGGLVTLALCYHYRL
jgi:hypothetical protein